MSSERPTLRIDKWLWQARFFKTRTLAAEMVAKGRVRVNARRIVKPAHAVGPGDVLTVVQGDRVRVVRVTGLPGRRGPAGEAALLYDETPEGLSHPVDSPGAATT